MTQIKGDGEAHPRLSPNDEFADYGTWDKGNIGGVVKKTDDMLEFAYARAALLNGLVQESRLGVNPFKFGMVGSTDAHTSIAGTREDNFFGKTPSSEPAQDRWEHVFMKGAQDGTTYYNWETLASGLAAVWARENTRESISRSIISRRSLSASAPDNGRPFTKNAGVPRTPASSPAR